MAILVLASAAHILKKIVKNDGHSDRCEMIPHCGFYFHFSNSELCWVCFHVYVDHPSIFFGETVCLLPIFALSCLFFWYWAAWAGCIILKINPLSVSFAIIFSHSEGCLLKLFMVSIQWGTITRQSGWPLSKSLQAMNAGEGVEKREPSYTVGGNAN